jgi:hypothetical protein
MSPVGQAENMGRSFAVWTTNGIELTDVEKAPTSAPLTALTLSA